QLVIGFVQPDDSKSGQVERPPHPIEASASSSPLPQSLSAPPQDFAMLEENFVARIGRTRVTVGSLVHTVEGGNCPLVLPSSHLPRAFVRPCTYLAEAFATPRWHLSGSAMAPVDAPRTTMVTSAAPNERLASRVMFFPHSFVHVWCPGIFVPASGS